MFPDINANDGDVSLKIRDRKNELEDKRHEKGGRTEERVLVGSGNDVKSARGRVISL
jgi:hypothetical protein